jgi:phosphonoacetaldehyde hydrolase
MSKIKAIILDWAGTTVDYGCFAPVAAFAAAFEAFGLTPTMEETRAPMGLAKRAHIAKMLEGERLASLWAERYGHAPTAEDVARIYDRFEPALFEVLSNHAQPMPGVLDTVRRMREMGISIGSTTGYTRAMMEVVAPLAKAAGYAPDCLVCPDETGGIGRPYPYMIWRNLEKLGVAEIGAVLKIGDTDADMREGKNAGCLCVGVLKGSSMLGLTQTEFEQTGSAEVATLLKSAKQKYLAAGADFVIEEIAQLPGLIASIE